MEGCEEYEREMDFALQPVNPYMFPCYTGKTPSNHWISQPARDRQKTFKLIFA